MTELELVQTPVIATPHPKSFQSFLLFWIGQRISLLGSTVVMFAIIWFLTDISPANQRNLNLSIISFLSLTPIIILSPIAGVISDRIDRRLLIFLADGFQALTTAILLILFQWGTVRIWHIFLLSTLRSIGQAFHEPPVMTLTALLVPKKHISRINGLNFLFSSIARLAGPVIAAFLMVFLPLQWILSVDIITFIIAMIPLVCMKSIIISNAQKTNDKCRTNALKNSKESFGTKFREGLRTLREIPGLSNLLIFGVIANFFFQPFDVLLPNFIKYEHLGGAQELAYIMAACQLGMLLGGILVSIKKSWRHTFWVFTISCFVQNLLLVIIGIVQSGHFTSLYVFATIMTLLNPVLNTIIISFLQLIVPTDKIGRVFSILTSLLMVASPIAMIMAGPLVDLVGSIEGVYILCGIGSLLAILFILTPKTRAFFNYAEKKQFETADIGNSS